MKKGKFSKACVALMFTSVFVFTIVMIVLFVRFQAVPEPLILSFFAFWGVEGGALAWIRNCDTKHKKKRRKGRDNHVDL